MLNQDLLKIKSENGFHLEILSSQKLQRNGPQNQQHRRPPPPNNHRPFPTVPQTIHHRQLPLSLLPHLRQSLHPRQMHHRTVRESVRCKPPSHQMRKTSCAAGKSRMSRIKRRRTPNIVDRESQNAASLYLLVVQRLRVSRPLPISLEEKCRSYSGIFGNSVAMCEFRQGQV